MRKKLKNFFQASDKHAVCSANRSEAERLPKIAHGRRDSFRFGWLRFLFLTCFYRFLGFAPWDIARFPFFKKRNGWFFLYLL
jgi:hypothetical protein